MISKIDDKDLLMQLQSLIAEMIAQNLAKPDFWDELTYEQQIELEKALKEIKKKENLVDHQVVLDKYKKWQKHPSHGDSLE